MDATAHADPEPDDAVIYEFLTKWFAGCNHGLVELGWIHAGTGKLNQAAFGLTFGWPSAEYE